MKTLLSNFFFELYCDDFNLIINKINLTFGKKEYIIKKLCRVSSVSDCTSNLVYLTLREFGSVLTVFKFPNVISLIVMFYHAWHSCIMLKYILNVNEDILWRKLL